MTICFFHEQKQPIEVLIKTNTTTYTIGKYLCSFIDIWQISLQL